MSAAGSSDREKLRNRAYSHKLIFEHAVAAQISHETYEMSHFARELFLLSRQCGAVGLGKEARMLFELSRRASGAKRSRNAEFVLYGLGARLLGWQAMGTLACGFDRLRS